MGRQLQHHAKTPPFFGILSDSAPKREREVKKYAPLS